MSCSMSRLGEERRDVVGLELRPGRDFARLHQRREHVRCQSAFRIRESRGRHGHAELLQERVCAGSLSGHARADEALQMLQEVPAEDVAGAIAARDTHRCASRRRDRHRDRGWPGGCRCAPRTPPRGARRYRAGDVSIPLSHVSCACGLRARLPQIERRDRQEAIGLRAAAARRQRAEAAHVVEEVAARPLEVGPRQPGLGADHVAEEVAPARPATARCSCCAWAAVALEPALDAAERRQDAIEPQPERGAGVQRVVVVEPGVPATSRSKLRWCPGSSEL